MRPRKRIGGLVLGFDIGTTNCKAALYTASGQMIGESSAPLTIDRPVPRWVEQDAESYWKAASRAIRRLLRKTGISGNEIMAIGSCGQTPTLVLVDTAGKPIRPAIVWQDTRAQDEADELRHSVGRDVMRELLGMDLPIEPTYPPARLLWLKRNEPQVMDRVYKILQPKDFVNLKLGGEIFSDAWDSKGLVHQETGLPHPDYYQRLGIDATIAPRVISPCEVGAQITPWASKITGLAVGTPIVTGWSDALTGILGTGALVDESHAFDLSGTSEIVGIVSRPQTIQNAQVLVAPVVDRTAIMVYGPTQSSGDSILWFGEHFGKPASTDRMKARDVERVARQVTGGNGELIFLPYLQGERAPIWDSRARGAFLGISKNHCRADFALAVLEGIAFSVRHVLDTAERATNLKAEQVHLGGGGAASGLMNRIKASVLNREVMVPDRLETGTLGAAILASVGAGIYSDLETAAAAMVNVASRIAPEKSTLAYYQEKYERYTQFYSLLRPVFGTLR